MPDKRRVLFVDDEPRVLDGLRRMLYPMRHEWEMAFATSGREALEILAQEPFDVIVTDMRMPGMGGVDLLQEVMRRHPNVVRIVLSGQAEREAIARAVGPAHQFLSKPCDAETLRSTLARACALGDLLADKRLKQLVSRMETLPSLPSLYCEIMRELESPKASAKTIGQIVEQDIGMSAKVLQLVNSAFFGLPQRVSSPAQAVVLLGLDTIRMLVLSVGIFAQFDQSRLRALSLTTLWDHSLTVAAFAKRIAENASTDRRIIDHAFTAGLLHDVGKLVLAASLPQEYAASLALAEKEGTGLSKAEQTVIGASHADVGAYLLGLWGLPEPIVVATAFHDIPPKYLDKDFSPLTAVYVANLLAHERFPQHVAGRQVIPEPEYLDRLGLAARLPLWRQICFETARAVEDTASNGEEAKEES